MTTAASSKKRIDDPHDDRQGPRAPVDEPAHAPKEREPTSPPKGGDPDPKVPGVREPPSKEKEKIRT